MFAAARGGHEAGAGEKELIACAFVWGSWVSWVRESWSSNLHSPVIRKGSGAQGVCRLCCLRVGGGGCGAGGGSPGERCAPGAAFGSSCEGAHLLFCAHSFAEDAAARVAGDLAKCDWARCLLE
jgi:hypothetical protein